MDFFDLFKWGWGVILPHSWYLHRKIDKLQEEHVQRAEYNGTIDSLRREIRDGNQEIRNRLDTLLQSMLDRK